MYELCSENKWEPDPAHDEPGYAILGSGYELGANLLIHLLGFEPQNSWKFDLPNLASFIINQVSQVDSDVGSFEGNGCWIARAPLTREFEVLCE